MTDLVERLRRPSERLANESLGDLCREAADEIERLRGALEPFAKCSTGREDEVPDDTTVQAKTLYYHMGVEHIARLADAGHAIPNNRVSLVVSFDGLTIGDFRKARAALEEQP